MKYKVGDKVRIRSKEWYESHKNKFGKIWTVCLSGEGTICFDQDNAKYCGKEVTIFSVEPDNYVLRGIPYEWTDEMIEGLVEEENNNCEKCGLIRNSTRCLFMDNCPHNKQKNIIEIPEDYVIKDENGNVINATKIVLEKKKKEYPKTYEECCDTLYRNGRHDECYEACLQGHPMQTFARLLICRDAYWKLYGEEMGLEKPWEPDWDGGSLYLFYYNPQRDEFVKIHYSLGGSANSAFVFPTAEMRDAYMENFDPDIEKCKLLL